MFLWPYLAPFLLITAHLCKALPVPEGCEEFTALKLHHTIIGTRLRVRLLLYTRDDDSCGALLSHTNLTAHPQFNMSKPTTFVVHGFRPTGSPPLWLGDLTKRLLAIEDINVVIVDWNNGAATLNYFKAVENTYKVAENLTAFIKMMQDHGASLSSLHMIGVSLGAHISGFVGANLNSLIGRITALDPAGPNFTDKPPEARLDPTDAQFVDVLHTDIDSLGYRAPLGHVDFYANGGTDQPGCPKTLFSGSSYFKCDHQRSVFLFLDTVNETCRSPAFPCSSFADFQDGKCTSCDSFGDAGCPIFGYDVIQRKDILIQQKQTKYYFTTNADSPFCVSSYKVDVKIWNKNTHWGYIDIKLRNGSTEAKEVIEHKATNFNKSTDATLLAQFDRDIQRVKTVVLKYHPGRACHSQRKLRILKIRFTPLDHKERALCRYDVLLENKKEVEVALHPCVETQP
ncbi:lipase member H [Fundulus diaphanus]